MAAPIPVKYRGFLSYSHADASWAKWLHRRLEDFRIDKDLTGRETVLGPVPKTLRPIFKDREDFSGGHTLKGATIAALDQSAALIVLCSPISCKSAYVNEEVRLFKSRHPDRPIVPVIIEGAPPDNFPVALRYVVMADGKVTDQPLTILAADLRETGDGKMLALAKVIAGITGVATDEIAQRAIRAERAATWRRRRNYAVVVASLTMMAAAGVTYNRWFPIADAMAYRIANSRRDLSNPGETFRDCSSCAEMVVVPAGTFMMGSPENEKFYQKDEQPRHKVTIAKPFAVSKFEVTFDEWDACVRAGACANYHQVDDQGWGRGKRPVISVSRNGAKAYAEWLSERTRQQYRLLSEAEWEYAARAGATTNYSWGDDIGTGNANCDGCNIQRDGQQKTSPVGSFAANRFGLFDMHGNVFEWVEDCWHNNYNGAPNDGSAWTTSCLDENVGVVRGGSWQNGPQALRAASRFENSSDRWDFRIGFRLARTLTQ
jgi:formylglycine-generating enzyme required for sulfatase activity